MKPAEVTSFSDRWQRAWRLPFFVALLFGLGVSGCSDDDDGTVTLAFSVQPTSLAADGSNVATVNVLVSVGSAPAPDGRQVTLFAGGGDGASGVVDGSGESSGTAPTAGGLGRAQFTVACGSEGQMRIAAVYDGTRAEWSGRINCLDQTPGSAVLRLSAQPQLIGTNGTSVLTAIAETAAGTLQPEGTPIRFEIEAGSIEFEGGGTSRVRLTGANGRAVASIRGTGEETQGRVCATYANEALAAAPRCLNILVTDQPPEGALCSVSFSQSRAPANGQEITDIDVLLLDETATPIRNARIDVSVQNGVLVSERSGGEDLGPTAEAITDEEGRAVAYVRSSTTPGILGTSASATWIDGRGEQQFVDCLVEEDLALFARPVCRFEGMSPGFLGVAESGRNESGRLRFCFADAAGTPVRQGERVQFSFITRIGGARLSAETAVTDGGGCVATEVFSGTLAGQLEVQAVYPFGETATVCSTGALSVFGARPTADGWTLQCTPKNVGAMVSSPVSYEAADITEQNVSVTCSTILRDRFGNPVNFPGTEVFFHAEQGTIQSRSTPNANGVVTTTYNPNGTKPVNVLPRDGEARLLPRDGSRPVNPRDMLVTIVAWTQGEEGFRDANGNGRFDDGEVFFDLGEPLFDYNDNDQYDPASPLNERFIDIETGDESGDGTFQGPNNRWDGDTIIWTQTRVLLTGRPVFGPIDSERFETAAGTSSTSFYSGLRDLATGQAIPGGGIGELRLAAGASREYDLVLRDRWLNPPNANVTTTIAADGCTNLVTVQAGPAPNEALGVQFEREAVGYTSAGVPATSEGDIASFRFRTLLPGLEDVWTQNVRVTRQTGAAILPPGCNLRISVTVGGGGGSPHNQVINIPIRDVGF